MSRWLKVRAGSDWRRWLRDLADHCHVTEATAIEQALWRYAEGVGFNRTPPRRNETTSRRPPTVADQIRAEQHHHQVVRTPDEDRP